MLAKAKSKDVRIYQIKVTLKDSRPPIWRRIQVTGDITLRGLHQIVQIAMGWTGHHLHMFTIEGEDYGEPDPEFDLTPMHDDKRVKLSKVVDREKARFAYTYDFGDGWDHSLLVEKILPPQEDVQYPVCLAGARACPPEDCGGIYSYAEFLGAIRDPSHKRHEELLEWIGGSFDPEAFDMEEVNRELRQLGSKRWAKRTSTG